MKNKARLAKFHLIATRTTGGLLKSKAGLKVECFRSGPLGGDVQIADRVVEGQVAGVIFLVDPLGKHPHEPDIQTLLRACNVQNVALATNVRSAQILLEGLSGSR